LNCLPVPPNIQPCLTIEIDPVPLTLAIIGESHTFEGPLTVASLLVKLGLEHPTTSTRLSVKSNASFMTLFLPKPLLGVWIARDNAPVEGYKASP